MSEPTHLCLYHGPVNPPDPTADPPVCPVCGWGVLTKEEAKICITAPGKMWAKAQTRVPSPTNAPFPTRAVGCLV